MMALAVGCAAIWLGLLLARGGFWRFGDRDGEALPDPARWPAVVAVVPARDEADVIARSIGSLLAQDYPGDFRVVLVDDQSSDGTAEGARAIGDTRLTVIAGSPRPAGWTGKLWALEQGIAAAGGEPLTRSSRAKSRDSRECDASLDFARDERDLGGRGDEREGAPAAPQSLDFARDERDLGGRGNAPTGSETPAFLWLTDADIGHAPDTLRRLVARAEQRNLAMVSLMARLHCVTPAERALIPAFVYFFAMLYPFARVNDPVDGMAAAAGGCVLVRREVLAAAGGIAAIRGAIIDDCALARAIKPHGGIWLGLADRAASLRPYSFDDIRRMVARSAYAQLGYSPLLLSGMVAGMLSIYLAPPLLALAGTGAVRMAGGLAWAVMALTMQPILRFYRASPLWGVALPLIAVAYTGFTLDSAVQHWRGRGGMWKGRAQALRA